MLRTKDPETDVLAVWDRTSLGSLVGRSSKLAGERPTSIEAAADAVQLSSPSLSTVDQLAALPSARRSSRSEVAEMDDLIEAPRNAFEIDKDDIDGGSDERELGGAGIESADGTAGGPPKAADERRRRRWPRFMAVETPVPETLRAAGCWAGVATGRRLPSCRAG